MAITKKIKYIYIFLALIFIFTPVLFSCEFQSQSEKEVETEWNKIKDGGSVEDLLNFIENPEHKGGKYFNEASQRIKDKIKSEENPDKLTELINKYPEWEIYFKDRVSEIELKIEEELKNKLFNEAKEQKSIELLEEFIKIYEAYENVLTEEAAKIIKEINDENEWNDIIQAYKPENGLLPLINFIDSHPDSKYNAEIENLIKQIREDSSYSEKYFAEPDLDLIDKFINNFPGHKDMDKALEIKADFIGDIYSMIEKEYISVLVLGDSKIRSRFIIQNRVKSRLEVTIPMGTYLAVNSGSVQNMIVRKEKIFTVESEKHGALYVDTACVNIYKDAPDDTNYFLIKNLPEDSEMIKLLKILDANNSSYEVSQAAIWIKTDNPGKDAILAALVYENNDGVQEFAIAESDYNEAIETIKLAELAGK